MTAFRSSGNYSTPTPKQKEGEANSERKKDMGDVCGR